MSQVESSPIEGGGSRVLLTDTHESLFDVSYKHIREHSLLNSRARVVSDVSWPDSRKVM